MGAKKIPEGKLQTFAEAYVESWNGAKAAQTAGYTGSSKVLSESARKLLRRDDVKAMIEALLKENLVERKATREERQRWWTSIMQGEELTIDVTDLMGNVRRVKQRPTPQMRLKASELLGKSEGDFIEKHEHEVKGTVTILLPDNGRGDGPPGQPDPLQNLG